MGILYPKPGVLYCEKEHLGKEMDGQGIAVNVGGLPHVVTTTLSNWEQQIWRVVTIALRMGELQLCGESEL